MSIPSPALKFFSHNNNKEKFDEFLIKQIDIFIRKF